MQNENIKNKKSSFEMVRIVFPTVAILFTLYNFYTPGSDFKQIIPHFHVIGAFIPMVAMEVFFKYKKRVKQTKLLLRDVISNAFHLFITSTYGPLLFLPLIDFSVQQTFGRGWIFAERTSAGPIWFQAIIAFLFFSFVRFAIHYYQHHNKYLWELHSYHHAVTDIQASNTLVSHPIDYLLRVVLPPLLLASMGLQASAVMIATTLIFTFDMFSHCGAGLRAGWLNHIFVTPELHRWHHAADVPEGFKYSVNFGVGVIIWDRLFGTYYLPKKDGVPITPERIGHPSGYQDEPSYLKICFLTRYWPTSMKF